MINKFSYVSEETRQRVNKVVEQLGYQPSTLARSLSQQRSYTLGVITFGLKHIGPSRTLNAMIDKADELGYMLLIRELDIFTTKRIVQVIDSLLSRQVDGILWAVPEIGQNHAWLDDHLEKIPVLLLCTAMQPRTGISSVTTDNFQGAVLAIEHLLACGRKKIGHISGPLDWWESDERKRGWRETLNKSGLNALEEHCMEGNWSSASGQRAFIQLIESFPDMDAVFAANDQMALGVLYEAARRGIQIPEQLAVVGFDNIPESAYFYPSISTISQDLQAIGEYAVQNIVEMIQARQQNQIVSANSILIQPALVVRESSKQV